MKMRITVQGTSYDVEVDMVDGGVTTSAPVISRPTASAPVAAAVSAPAPSAGPSVGGAKAVNAPVGGTIITVAVKAGEKVTKGTELLVLEAMKMQTSIASPVDGVVKKVHVAAAEIVRDNQLLVEFE